MTQEPANTATPVPQGLANLTHLMYGLHAFSALTGLMSAAFVVTAFLTGWPSIIAVIINFAKRDEAFGTYLESHFRWQWRTFWFALLWLAFGALMAITVILLPVAWLLLGVVGLWVLYRIVRGWLALADAKAVASQAE
jgi:uncharacterized membrane protein